MFRVAWQTPSIPMSEQAAGLFAQHLDMSFCGIRRISLATWKFRQALRAVEALQGLLSHPQI